MDHCKHCDKQIWNTPNGYLDRESEGLCLPRAREGEIGYGQKHEPSDGSDD